MTIATMAQTGNISSNSSRKRDGADPSIRDLTHEFVEKLFPNLSHRRGISSYGSIAMDFESCLRAAFDSRQALDEECNKDCSNPRHLLGRFIGGKDYEIAQAMRVIGVCSRPAKKYMEQACNNSIACRGTDCIPPASSEELEQIAELAATLKYEGPGGRGNKGLKGGIEQLFTAWDAAEQAMVRLRQSERWMSTPNAAMDFESCLQADFKSRQEFDKQCCSWGRYVNPRRAFERFISGKDHEIAQATRVIGVCSHSAAKYMERVCNNSIACRGTDCTPPASGEELDQITELAAKFKHEGPGGEGNQNLSGGIEQLFTAWDAGEDAMSGVLTNFGSHLYNLTSVEEWRQNVGRSLAHIWLPTSSTLWELGRACDEINALIEDLCDHKTLKEFHGLSRQLPVEGYEMVKWHEIEQVLGPQSMRQMQSHFMWAHRNDDQFETWKDNMTEEKEERKAAKKEAVMVALKERGHEICDHCVSLTIAGGSIADLLKWRRSCVHRL